MAESPMRAVSSARASPRTNSSIPPVQAVEPEAGPQGSAIENAEDLESRTDLADLRSTQLGPAAGAGWIQSLQLPRGSAVEFEVMPFDVMVQTAIDRALLVVPLDKSGSVHINGRFLWQEGAYEIVGPGTGCLGFSPAWTPLLGMTFEPSALEAAADSLDAQVHLPGAGDLISVEDADGSIDCLTRELASELASRRSVLNAEALESELVETVVGALAGNRERAAGQPQARARSFSIVADAEALAAQRGWRLVAIKDICRQIGVSETRLRRAFRDIFGCSPKRFLTTRALNSARQMLQGADPDRETVSSTAAELGFWHYGRFAHDYCRLFDELPSETLRSNRLPTGRGGWRRAAAVRPAVASTS